MRASRTVRILVPYSKTFYQIDRGRQQGVTYEYGKAFENWVHHELVAGAAYHAPSTELSYWRLASGIEVDFIVGPMTIAIEAKASARITSGHLDGLRHLHADHPRARRVVVCLEPKRRVTSDGIEILPVNAFIRMLPELLLAA